MTKHQKQFVRILKDTFRISKSRSIEGALFQLGFEISKGKDACPHMTNKIIVNRAKNSFKRLLPIEEAKLRLKEIVK